MSELSGLRAIHEQPDIEHLGEWDDWLHLYDQMTVVGRAAMAHLSGHHADGRYQFCVLCGYESDAADLIDSLTRERDEARQLAREAREPGFRLTSLDLNAALAERDELTATVERLERALNAMEQAFDRLNEPDPIWMVDDSCEHRATGAAIVRNAARAVLDTEEVGDRE